MGLLEEYDEQAPRLIDLSAKLEILLGDLLAAESLRVHSVSTRVKSRDSLENKLNKQVGKYEAIAQITDLCGARVITYFEDQVGVVSKLVEREFEIDDANSIYKGQLLDPDRFGYLSVHYVVSLKSPR